MLGSLGEILWALVGWFVLASFRIFAGNWPCLDLKLKTRDRWDLDVVTLPDIWSYFHKRGDIGTSGLS